MGIKVQRSEKVSAVVFTVSVGRGGGGAYSSLFIIKYHHRLQVTVNRK
jgi:hypothetical protein